MKRFLLLTMLFGMGGAILAIPSQNCLIYRKFIPNDYSETWGISSVCYITILPELIYKQDTQRVLRRYFSREEIDSILTLSKDLKEVSINKELYKCNPKWERVSKERARKRYEKYLTPEREKWTLWQTMQLWTEITYLWKYPYTYPTYFFTQPIYFKKYVLMESKRGKYEYDALTCLFLLDTESNEVTEVYCVHKEI